MAERILVVDDDESLVELCAAAFRLDGLEVETAPGGEQALQRVEQGSFDLVVSDLMMPGKLDGLGLLRALKARFPSLEVVMMTASPTLRTAIAALKDGASDYIIKPFETDHLRLVARRALENRRLKAELAAERSMRQELASAYAELQKVEQLKESFLARIGHELRTPLSEMLAAADLMEAGSADGEKMEKYVALSKSGARRLDRVLSDLLAYVELQRKPDIEKRQPVSLESLCREAAAKLKPIWEPRGVEIELRFDANVPAVSGNAALLARAIEHLIQNAVLFNREKGKITVSGKSDGESVRLSVADTGEGIPESEFDRIFDSFYQIASYLTRKVGGLGLGLAIVRRIVEAHGGRIDVSSRVGEGTTFRVQLPIAAKIPA